MKILQREMETMTTPQGGVRVVRFLANTQTKDRHGTVVLPQGVKLENFWKNPVFCWSHPQPSLVPPDPDDVIGRVLTVEVSPEGLFINVEFAPAEVNLKADRCYRAVQAGFLRAVSIGFETIAEHTEGNGSDEVTIISEWELLEVSLVIIGSNPDAVALRKLITNTPTQRGCPMTKKDAYKKLSLPDDASKEDAQKAYRDYAEKTDDDEETKKAVKRAIEDDDSDKDQRADDDAKKDDTRDDSDEDKEKRALMNQMSREVKTLRSELGTLKLELENAQTLQKGKDEKEDVARWIQEGRYPAQKRDKLLELHKKGKAKEIIESIEPGTFASPGKRMFVGGDPFQIGQKPVSQGRLNEFDQRVIAVFEKQGLKIDQNRYLQDKQEVEARMYR